jgi:aspartate carbamoyltransferase regulatory subunit
LSSARNQLYVKKIRNGTVIDHIDPGHALDVLHILNITGKKGELVSAVLNVESKQLERKDIVKIEDRELNPQEVDKIALIAPKATINIIREYEVTSKKHVEFPRTIKGIITCNNPSCVVNAREPVTPEFKVETAEPFTIRCHYCGRIMGKDDVLRQF